MATVQFERHPHDREHPYSIISNDIIRHPTLSLDTIALLIRMLSLPSGWRMTEESLRKFNREKPIGRDVMSRMMRELREHGYLEKVAIRDEAGKVTEWRWYVREHPKPAAEMPSDDGFSQKAGNPCSGSDCVSEGKMPSQCVFSQNTGFPPSGQPAPIRKTEREEILNKQAKKDGDACLLPLEREILDEIQDMGFTSAAAKRIACTAAKQGFDRDEVRALWCQAEDKADTNPQGMFITLLHTDGLAQIRLLRSRAKADMARTRVEHNRNMIDEWSDQFGHEFYAGRLVHDGIMRFRCGLEFNLLREPTALYDELIELEQSIWRRMSP